MVRNTYEVQNVGDLLREKRKQLGFDIKQVADETRIRTEYLLALESGNFSKFPADVYAKGFLRRYAKYLGISPERAVAMYRRERNSVDEGKIKSTEFLRRKIKPSSFNLSAGKLAVFSAIALVLALGGYLVWQLATVLQDPELSLIEPVSVAAGERATYVTDEQSITLQGEIELGAELSLNGADVNVNNLQEFEIADLDLQLGENSFTLTATTQFGGSSEIELVVLRQEGSSETEQSDNAENNSGVLALNAEILATVDGTFVQVISDGEGVLARNLVQGESRQVSASEELIISSSSPESIVVNINGQEFSLVDEADVDNIFRINSGTGEILRE
ncbi:MAG: helix-turn-helix domain-containing protein [Candidatus Dojkabacteria bacterium]